MRDLNYGTLSISIMVNVPHPTQTVKTKSLVLFTRSGLEKDEAISIARSFREMNTKLSKVIDSVVWQPDPVDISEESYVSGI